VRPEPRSDGDKQVERRLRQSAFDPRHMRVIDAACSGEPCLRYPCFDPERMNLLTNVLANAASPTSQFADANRARGIH
ncbi:MAG TPA: hypothetical protein VJ850_10585, partial [Candidatus Limnocylindrales bacterium]|nr:hypothetical protein [Candidatus Limnocylindrales bacterium]